MDRFPIFYVIDPAAHVGDENQNIGPELSKIKQEIKSEILDLNYEICEENNETYDEKSKIPEETGWKLQDDFVDVPGDQEYKGVKLEFYEKCDICFKTFSDSYNLIKHKAIHLSVALQPPSIYQCDHCATCFTNKTKLCTHLHTKHKKLFYPICGVTKSKHRCKKCSKTFSYKSYWSHMNEVHGSKKLKCNVCELVFKCQRYLNKHMTSRHNEMKRKSITAKKCDECSKVFKNFDGLYQHRKNVHGNSAVCEVCNSVLKSEVYLRSHMRRVHYSDGKIYKCEFCRKEFRSKRYLNIHRRNSHIKMFRSHTQNIKYSNV